MLSIVTITYNNFEELKRTISSLPTDGNFESLIINGGNDKEEIESLQTLRTKIVNEKDSGIADAFNKGIKHATGNAILFLNSGDVLLKKEYLLNAEKLLGDANIDFIHSNLLFKDRLGIYLVMKPRMKNPGRGMPFLHPTMIIKRKIFDEIGGFNKDYKIAMDFEFILRMLKKGYTGMYIDSDPVVEMDGKGKSSFNEFEAIVECRKALKQNNE